MRQAELEMDTKALWCLILTWANKDGTNAYPTRETLCEVSGKKMTWVKKHLKILKDKGYLKIGKARKHGARHSHNVYILSCRGAVETPYGGARATTTKSLNQNSDSLSVESEAILRVVPRVEEEPAKYGLQA